MKLWAWLSKNKHPMGAVFGSVLLALAALQFSARTASAWLLGPPATAKVDRTDIINFEGASRTALLGAANLFEALHKAEMRGVPIKQENLLVAGLLIQRSAKAYEALKISSIAKVKLNWEAVAKQSPGLAQYRIRAEGILKRKIKTGADLAEVLAMTLTRVVTAISRLARSLLSPNTPDDSVGREALHQIIRQISRYVQIANAGAMALASQ